MEQERNEERGGAIDLFEVMFVTVIVFALMLVYFQYARGIRMKMAIDLAAKNALYQMEETGGWTTEIDTNFKKELVENGIHLTKDASPGAVESKDNQDIVLTNQSSGTSGVDKARYGEQVKMNVTIYFKNPTSDVFGRVWEGISPQVRRPITYHIVRSTTCRA